MQSKPQNEVIMNNNRNNRRKRLIEIMERSICAAWMRGTDPFLDLLINSLQKMI